MKFFSFLVIAHIFSLTMYTCASQVMYDDRVLSPLTLPPAVISEAKHSHKLTENSFKSAVACELQGAKNMAYKLCKWAASLGDEAACLHLCTLENMLELQKLEAQKQTQISVMELTFILIKNP